MMAGAGELQGPSNSLAFSADGQAMASAIFDGIALWSARLGNPPTELHEPGGMHVRSLAISSKAPVVAVAVGSSVRRWRLPDRSELPALEPRDSARTPCRDDRPLDTGSSLRSRATCCKVLRPHHA
jgi:hypothetical protein